MYTFVTRAQGTSYYSDLIDHCLSLKSLDFIKFIHAQLIKLGLNTRTYLGNRVVDIYSKFGTVDDALHAFDEITNRNTISWNICLKGFIRSGQLDKACQLFDEIQQRDVVSWNSMVSGFVQYGHTEYAFELFSKMQNAGIRPNGFTYSILTSIVSSISHGKEIHGSMIRSGVMSFSVVPGNSLISMYGDLGLLDYAFGVFLTAERLDIISWNSLMSGCSRAGYVELAIKQFSLMRSFGFLVDPFTLSSVISSFSHFQDFEKGKQIFALCVKLGFLYHNVALSAIIDMFSKCNKLDVSVRLFQEIGQWDLVICDSMISSYARHGYGEEGLQLFILTIRKNLMPTEFTLSSVLSFTALLFPIEQGIQVHSLVVKLGMESDAIIASSLVKMYSKFGLIDLAMKIFAKMVLRDLISWNTIIMGLARNGRVVETLDIFHELLKNGLQPDRITLEGVLLACSYGGFVNEGLKIFSSMEKEYGTVPNEEHYACVIDMMARACKLKEATEIIEKMPHEPNALILETLLRASLNNGELKLAEKLAEQLMELDPHFYLPYTVLASTYEMRGKWERVVRVMKAVRERGVKRVVGCSMIGIKNHVYFYKANQVIHYGGKDVYSILHLLNWEMEDAGCVSVL